MRVRHRLFGVAEAQVLAEFPYQINGERFAFAVTQLEHEPACVTLVCTGARFCQIDPDALRDDGALKAGFFAVRALISKMDERAVWRLIQDYPKL